MAHAMSHTKACLTSLDGTPLLTSARRFVLTSARLVSCAFAGWRLRWQGPHHQVSGGGANAASLGE